MDRMRITRWRDSPVASEPEGPTVTLTPIGVGDYLCSERELYHVEQVGSEHAMIENCRTGELIDALVADLSLLRRVNTG
jgi:hypothetical protein